MQNEYDDGMKWNDRLRKARDAAGVKDTQIAEACGVKPPSVHGWMSGDTVSIEARFLLPACKLLQVSPFYIMFGEEVPGIDLIQPGLKIEAMDVLRLIGWFSQADEQGKNYILDAAKNATKQ